jgi:hypothetical protein
MSKDQYYPPPHGTQTDAGLYIDGRPTTIDTAWDAAHFPECGIIECEYEAGAQLGFKSNTVKLTYHAGDGEWYCPRHWPVDFTEVSE